MVTGPINIFEFEAIAKTRLRPSEYDFVAGGATDEITIRRTREVLDSIGLLPRVLSGIDDPELATTLLGERVTAPIVAGPAGHQNIPHPDGELATARAFGAAGALMVLSSGSSRTLEEVAKAGAGPLWYQQFLYRDEGFTREMVTRAVDAGYRAICITLDSGVRHKRERNIRNGFVDSPSPNYGGIEVSDLRRGEGVGDEPRGIVGLINRTATWSDFAQFVEACPLPVVAKGIISPQDARLAVEHGAKGIVVSNHGGRQLDTAITTMEALPGAVEAAGGRAEVYVDGGFRRGTDILKALALGARAVFVARPVFWGLAVGGEEGVAAALRILTDELRGALGMCGIPDVAKAERSTLVLTSPLKALG